MRGRNSGRPGEPPHRGLDCGRGIGKLARRYPMKIFLLLAGALLAASTIVAQPAAFTRTEDIVYARKFGTALTLDAFVPARPNGAAVLWIISGSFISDHDKISPKLFAPLLERGYTVFAVVHGCRPRFV